MFEWLKLLQVLLILFVSLEAMGDLLVTPDIFAMTPNERLGMHK